MLKPFEYILILLLVIVIGIVIVRTAPQGQGETQVVVVPGAGGAQGDDRYTRAPRPQRYWDNGPETPVRGALDLRSGASGGFRQSSALMDPIPTRGEPEAYQQMGVIVGADGKPLPLYGRRTAPRSDRFNYYTRTDQYNPVALPVNFKRKDCQDNLGCDEVMTGDSVSLQPTGETAKVMLYGFDGPRYVPDI